MLKNSVKFIYAIFILFFFTINTVFSEIVKKIEISGNDRIPSETINMLSGINLNEVINEDKLNKLLKNLYDTNFFKNLEISFDNNILKIFVTENPIISDIKINGIKAKRIKEKINSALTIREKSSFNEINLIEEKKKNNFFIKRSGISFCENRFL